MAANFGRHCSLFIIFRHLLCSLFLVLKICERGEKGGFTKAGILNVSINLCSIQMLMSEKLLESSDVNSVMQH